MDEEDIILDKPLENVDAELKDSSKEPEQTDMPTPINEKMPPIDEAEITTPELPENNTEEIIESNTPAQNTEITETKPETVVIPAPDISPVEPELDPIIVPKTEQHIDHIEPPAPEIEQKIDTTPTPPIKHTPKEKTAVEQNPPKQQERPGGSSSGTPPAVANLTDEELKIASALYAKKNQKVLSQQGVAKRQAVAAQNIAEIKKFINSHSPASNQTIARALNLPPRRVQHYMRILTHNGTVTATGWAQSRRYHKK